MAGWTTAKARLKTLGAKDIAIIAVFSGLVFVLTMIAIPMPAGGIWHLGNAMIILTGLIRSTVSTTALAAVVFRVTPVVPANTENRLVWIRVGPICRKGPEHRAERTVAITPTCREIRDPWMIRLSISRPNSSVPRGNSLLGGKRPLRRS